jgi:hypothetical protein
MNARASRCLSTIANVLSTPRAQESQHRGIGRARRHAVLKPVHRKIVGEAVIVEQ